MYETAIVSPSRTTNLQAIVLDVEREIVTITVVLGCCDENEEARDKKVEKCWKVMYPP